MTVLSPEQRAKMAQDTEHMRPETVDNTNQELLKREMDFRRREYLSRVIRKHRPRPSLMSRLATSSSLRALTHSLFVNRVPVMKSRFRVEA